MDPLTQFFADILVQSSTLGIYEKVLVTFIAWKFGKLAKDVHSLRINLEHDKKSDENRDLRLAKLEIMYEDFKQFIKNFNRSKEDL